MFNTQSNHSYRPFGRHPHGKRQKTNRFIRRHTRPNQVGLEGALLVLASLPLSLFSITASTWMLEVRPLIEYWQSNYFWGAAFAMVSVFITALFLNRKVWIGKVFGVSAILSIGYSLYPYLIQSPASTLVFVITAITLLFKIYDYSPYAYRANTINEKQCEGFSLMRIRWAAYLAPAKLLFVFILGPSRSFLSLVSVGYSAIIVGILMMFWLYRKANNTYKDPLFWSFGALTAIIPLLIFYNELVFTISLLMFVMSISSLPGSKRLIEESQYYWESIIQQPARVLIVTFLILCLIGTLLLRLPIASSSGEAISLIDASFTAVSAVCVTGLIVLDTPVDFSGTGQFFILLLIQLGGLGIMSITTLAMHILGQRISLKQERTLVNLTDTDPKELLNMLKTIFKYTFTVEFIGAISLLFLFRSLGDDWGMAIWRGLFTSISAFCNAGFALQSDSLVGYQQQGLILHTIGLLIIAGGFAPAHALLFGKWIRAKKVSPTVHLAFMTTAVLLFVGTFAFLSLEWNGSLGNLSFWDKINNAWFQSVTLRTAGFNSVNLSVMLSPTFMIMMVLMFIGGSPGGTAGGVKTTSIGILALTFWANIRNHKYVVLRGFRIRSLSIYKSISIVASGALIWFVIVLMLEVTQQINARDVIFEATSAIATVGLSTGATALLDEIGKLVVMLAMFSGRVGSVTLFMLLSREYNAHESSRPDGKITLT